MTEPANRSGFRLRAWWSRHGRSLLVRGLGAALSLAILAAAAASLARFFGIAVARIRYPYDLEWVEGGTLSHIRVVLSGKQIYREPSIEFTAFIYPPLYYYVSALVSLFLGVGHLAPRLVSLVSIAGAFVLLGRWVRDETDDPVAGVAAAGLLASVYQLTGFWFDLARVDSFFLCLTLAANLLARTVKTARGAATVGVLLACGCFTKQLGYPLAVPAVLLLAMRSLRLGVVAALVSGVLVVATFLAFNVSSGGWFYYFQFGLPSRHEIQWERLEPEGQLYFLASTCLMTLCGVALLCGVGFRRGALKEWLFHALFVALACATSFLPFLKTGGYPNGLIPAYAALALACGIELGSLRRSGLGSALGSLSPRFLGALLVVFQLWVLSYDPARALPTPADYAANQRVVARLARLPKPIFVTASSTYTLLAQKDGVLAHTTGMADVFKGGGKEGAHLHAMLTNAIRRHRWKTIVLDRAAGFWPGEFIDLIHREYVARGTVLWDVPPRVMWPKSGAEVRPDTIWVAP